MLSRTLRLRRTLCASVLLLAALLPAHAVLATQVVYLNFDRTGGDDYLYSQFEMDSIQTRMEADFSAFDFNFTRTEPTAGEYSTLFFNDGPAFGVAEAIDFRNQNPSDNARINIDPDEFPPGDFITMSANIGSRKLGQLVGLTHRDSLGPIGEGFSPDPGFLAEKIVNNLVIGEFLLPQPFPNPPYPGSYNATETPNHLMETSAVFGVDMTEVIQDPNARTANRYFGARSATKLAFNEQSVTNPGLLVSETAGLKQSFATAQPITLQSLSVPDTIEDPPGRFIENTFFVDAVAVTGEISSVLQKDYYSFDGTAGELINIEVISDSISETYDNTIDSRVMLFDENGQLVDYYGTDALNNDALESGDSILFDLYLPDTGKYYIRVDAESDINGNATDTGNYELFVYNFAYESVETIYSDFDIDQNGRVDMIDYTIWRDTEGDIVPPGTGADLDDNGKIDLLDYEKWALNYGSEALLITTTGPTAPVGPATTVPEPASALLAGLLLGVAGLNARRAS
ncbi:hypothetical protein MalM25_02830 [Planctomycetes bacterium MalM25]|nr:hypothetical protein MalM25_02830 [Planctomycetes bacterium MalM25]